MLYQAPAALPSNRRAAGDPRCGLVLQRITERSDITAPQLAAGLAGHNTEDVSASIAADSSALAIASNKLRANEQGRVNVRQARDHWRGKRQ